MITTKVAKIVLQNKYKIKVILMGGGQTTHRIILRKLADNISER